MSGARFRPLQAVWGLPLLVILLGVLTFFFGFLLQFWMAALSVGLAFTCLLGFKEGHTPSRRVLGALGLLLFGPVVIAGVLAPFRLSALGIVHWLKRSGDHKPLEQLLYLPFPPLPWLDTAMGLMGVAFTLYWAIRNRARILRVRDQIRNLPTSQIVGAAPGLAEFKGVARRVVEPGRAGTRFKRGPGADPAWEPEEARDCLLYERTASDDKQTFKKWSRFWLEDRSGRILVDPLGVDFWSGGSFLTIEAQSLMLRRRRRIAPAAGPGVLGTVCLREGDRVYVIGAVETDREAPPDATGPERLVIRPTKLYPARGIMSKLVPALEEPPAEDYRNTFFVYDRDEGMALKVLRKEERALVRTALVWLALSLGLFWTGYYHPIVQAGVVAPAIALQQPHGYACIRLRGGWITGFWPFGYSHNGADADFGRGFQDTPAGREEMAALLERMYPRLVIVQSTGGAERDFVSLLEKRGLRCAVVPPEDLKASSAREPTWGSPLWTFAVDLDAKLGDEGLPPPRPYPPARPGN